MARQTSFGEALRQARERKGLDLSTAARKLRIRPDILRAIEESDFARMPPRGYTSNMVGAYARLVGLNPGEVTRAYRDEAYRFETGQRPVTGRSERLRSADRGEGRADMTRMSARGDYAGASSRSSRPARSAERSRRGASAPSSPQYTNLVQGRQAPGISANFGSMLPVLVVGAIIVALLILVLFLAFGNNHDVSAEDAPAIPISGMPNPAGTDTGSSDASQNAGAPAVQPVAPTSAKFVYKVADGKEAYIEVALDGKTKEAGTVSGPKEMSYDVTGTLKFTLSGEPEDVEITVDGEKVEPTDKNGRGVYTYTVDFETVLEDWQRANGVSGSDSSDSADSGSGDADGGDDSSGDEGGSSDSSSSDSSDSSSDN